MDLYDPGSGSRLHDFIGDFPGTPQFWTLRMPEEAVVVAQNGRRLTLEATDVPVLDYANAMVPARQPSVSDAISNWQEHVDGKTQYAPPIPPLAPAKFTGGLYVAEGNKVRTECANYAKSLHSATRSFVEGVTPRGAGTTAGMLGFMFWAAERPAVRGVGTVPPNTCEGGVGAGASALGVTIPMPPLRQQ